MENARELSPQAAIMQLLSGQFISRCIGLAANLSVPDHLSKGTKKIEELAKITDTNISALYRVLRMLAGFGIFEELPGREFKNSRLSEILKSDVAGSVRDFARWFSDPMRWGLLGTLDYSVRTGNPGLLNGKEDRQVFELFLEYPESVDVFNKAMTSMSMGDSFAVIEAYDFSPYKKIIDVGGGHGHLALQIAKRFPETHVTVFDLPHVISGTEKRITENNMSDRVNAKGGSYLEKVPGSNDLIMMKNIVHGEKDENAVQLLKNCRSALNDGGNVLVIESVITNGPGGNGARILDIEMLIGPGGRQRTQEEHAKLFREAGFEFLRKIPLKSGSSILEAEISG